MSLLRVVSVCYFSGRFSDECGETIKFTYEKNCVHYFILPEVVRVTETMSSPVVLYKDLNCQRMVRNNSGTIKAQAWYC